MLQQSDIKKLHPGLHKCPMKDVGKFMPELLFIFNDFPGIGDEFTVDIKVHMLMPGQYACIGGWHRDNVPRDHGMQELDNLIDPSQKMFLWLSGPPITEFKDGRIIKPCTWVEFTQNDWHRGIPSDSHQWRVFARATPYTILRPNTPSNIMRRHSQVYMDCSDFKW